MAKKTKEEIQEMVNEITAKVTDVEVRKAAFVYAEKGMPVADAIELATEEVQKVNEVKENVVKMNEKKNAGRYRVAVTFLKGPAEGRTTEYWNDIAEKMEKRGEIRIDRKL